MKTKNLFAMLTACVAILGYSITAYASENDAITDVEDTASGDYVGISIDGSYDDWEDKPHSKIQYPWDSGNNFHTASLFRDEDYIYLHVRMSPYSYTQFNGYNYCFTVDGEETYVAVVPPEGKSIGEGENEVVVRAQNGYTLINDAGGVVSRHSGQSDEWELRIPLTFFTDNPDLAKEITFHCSNLGPQEIIATATPTLAIAVAGTGLIIAASSLYFTNKRKKSQ